MTSVNVIPGGGARHLPPRELLRAMFQAALEAADPRRCVPAHLPPPPRGRTIVIGAGKAAAAMARALEQHWPGPLSGLVVTRYGHAVPCERIEVLEAQHPVPDAASLRAADRMLKRVSQLGADDLVLCLISGGGSSVLMRPGGAITLADMRQLTQQLLRSGATIGQINCVRKHLSAIHGGRLALAARPARVVSLIISDVPGDDLSLIASGPTVADPSTCAEALQVLEHYHLKVPSRVRAWLASAAAETPKPDDPGLAAVSNVLICSAQQALEAAAACAAAHGVQPLILGDAIEAEARECANVHAGMALACARHGRPLPPPCVLISGGETTVRVRGGGRGGRNSEFLLALALALRAHPDIWSIACDTDGIDGTGDNAGAELAPDTLARVRALGLDAPALLEDNDALRLFEAVGGLVVTGPTRTNVNDFRAVLIDAPARA